MLTRLQVDGFKNLVGVDVLFGPFTCIAGINGAGKSNLFDAIRFLSRLASSTLLDAALAVRDDTGRNTDVRDLFHLAGGHRAPTMSFTAEMIVPSDAVDDLGQRAKATITLLRYDLKIGLRRSEFALNPAPLEILHESLEPIPMGHAPQHLLFPNSVKDWRQKVVHGRRVGAFISTLTEDTLIINLHQDAQTSKGGGRPLKRAAAALPRTVLSSATAAESPTVLCARKEMESWQLLQLEPSALRKHDNLSVPPHLSSNGGHLPATLYRLAERGNSAQVYQQITNRLSALIGSVRAIRVDHDEKRELLTIQMAEADDTELPARALSDGTLRFLALSVLELDPETSGVLCLEEPENGIHPERIPAILELLQGIATDARELADDTNPLRQVIINTHSPSVVMAAPAESLLLARSEPARQNGSVFSKVIFACVPESGSGENWRNVRGPRCPQVTRSDLLAYLNPKSAIREAAGSHGKPRRVIDHPKLFALTAS